MSCWFSNCVAAVKIRGREECVEYAVDANEELPSRLSSRSPGSSCRWIVRENCEQVGAEKRLGEERRKSASNNRIVGNELECLYKVSVNFFSSRIKWLGLHRSPFACLLFSLLHSAKISTPSKGQYGSLVNEDDSEKTVVSTKSW